jgi:MFS family permease
MQETMYGMNYIFAKRGLLGLVSLASVGNFMLGGVSALVLPMALTITSIRGYGSMMSISGISLLLGGLLMGVWGGPKRRILSLACFMVIQGFAIILGGLFPSMLVFVIAVSVFNFAASMAVVSTQVIFQTKVPQTAQGRVMAVYLMFTALALEAGIMGTATIADYVKNLFIKNPFLANMLPQFFGSSSDGRGLAFLIFTLGFLYVLATFALYFHPRIRFLERELPDIVLEVKPVLSGMVTQPAVVSIYEMDFDDRMNPDKK